MNDLTIEERIENEAEKSLRFISEHDFTVAMTEVKKWAYDSKEYLETLRKAFITYRQSSSEKNALALAKCFEEYLSLQQYAAIEGEWDIKELEERAENDLLSFAGDACIDFYMNMHVSEMRGKTEPEKKIWSIGQELYLAKRNSI